MNFKINLWTLLFVIALGALYYTNNMNKNVSAPFPICNYADMTTDSLPGSIRAETALGKIAAYEAYIDSVMVLDKSDDIFTNADKKDYNIPLDSIPQGNRKVEYFRITQPCELGWILSEAADSNAVFAYLSLEPNPEYKNGVEGMIDLIFKVKTGDSPGNFVDQNGFKYFDFTNPCKPLCAE